ncbi:hypothetical protein E2562_018253 [Oryza meyeriana var. granulata]|uniref:Uncharacterized protein n=1 Tax=Oryza meyeriana var. granulata TaxID=110450 RepID=A0A6G1CHY6_9ORYZ|nr:hypothetical protein E2562_018253 [Oryza meyeriana var. granulata]
MPLDTDVFCASPGHNAPQQLYALASGHQRVSFRAGERHALLIAAYLLAVLGGNTLPSANDVKNILESASYPFFAG